jgi:transposase
MSNYNDSEVMLRTELLGDKLCFSVAGKDDFELYHCSDGHTEIAFLTTLDNVEMIALKLIQRVKEVREYKLRKEKEKELDKTKGGLR